jgi:hypothetical protein
VGRFKVGLVAAALALPLAAPPAAAVAGQEAFAVWVRPEGKKLVAYFAVAERYVDPTGGGLVTAAGVAKGTCQRSGGRGFRMTLCSARGRVKEIPFEDFVVDPALGSATMTVTMAGRTHTVEWTAADRAPAWRPDPAAWERARVWGGTRVPRERCSGRALPDAISSSRSCRSLPVPASGCPSETTARGPSRSACDGNRLADAARRLIPGACL